MDLITGFINGLALASVPVILSYTSIENGIYIWIILVLLSYILSFSMNAVIQLINCGQIYPASIAKNSAYLPAFVTIFFGISYIGFFSWAIEGVLPKEMDSYTKQIISRAFYIFWGGVYGQLLSGGFVQSCN